MKCLNCHKNITGEPIKVEPSRHLTSPNSINFGVNREEDKYYEYYCSPECHKQNDKLRYKFFAELDRNASDSECFVHDHWETDSMHRRIRVGKCAVTGKEVRVEPLQPGDNSGQPIECYEHFKLRSNYR